MINDEEKKIILEWLKDTASDDTALEHHIGKTIKRIQYIGNGATLLTFTDNTHLMFRGGDPTLRDDLYTRDDTNFNFETWEWKE
jgi:hypothetical protein